MKTLLGFAVLLSALTPASASSAPSMNLRLERATRSLVGTHYVLDAFGEGESGVYDRDPLFRFDAFDCTTFVETAMALALSPAGDRPRFLETLLHIRYKNGLVGYTTRNHFPETDWIPNNTRAGFVRDVTERIAGRFGVEWARAVIDKRSWYEHKTADGLNVPGLDEAGRNRLLEQLHAEGRPFRRELSVMPYISIEHALFRNGEPVQALFDRIPGGLVMNVVRPDWDMSATEGTHLNVSHQALILRLNGQLIIRHATTGEFQRVVDQPLVEYLRKLLGHATVRGVNFLSIRD